MFLIIFFLYFIILLYYPFKKLVSYELDDSFRKEILIGKSIILLTLFLILKNYILTSLYFILYIINIILIKYNLSKETSINLLKKNFRNISIPLEKYFSIVIILIPLLHVKTNYEDLSVIFSNIIILKTLENEKNKKNAFYNFLKEYLIYCIVIGLLLIIK